MMKKLIKEWVLLPNGRILWHRHGGLLDAVTFRAYIEG